MRGIIVPGPVLPHPPALVPLLPVRPKPPQAEVAGLLIELASGKGRPRRRDRLELVPRPLNNRGVEPQATHHPLGAALQPQALAIPSCGIKCPERRPVLTGLDPEGYFRPEPA